VAAGIVVESYLSFKKKLISIDELESIEEYIFSIYGKVRLKESEIDNLVLYARNDKKNSSSKINFTLLDGVGKVKIDQEFGVKDFEEGMRYYITGSAIE
jgi:3-dehydroquinate synthase